MFIRERRGTKAAHYVRPLFSVLSVVLLACCVTGCWPIWFSMFQTASTLGKGNVGAVLGLSAIGDDEQIGVFMPQASLGVGLTDSVDLRIRSGFWLFASEELSESYRTDDMSEGDLQPMGVTGEVKVSVVDDLAALGLGVGHSCEFYTPGKLGWGLEATAYYTLSFLSGIVRVLYPLDSPGDGTSELSLLYTGAISIPISESVQLLFEIGSRDTTDLISFGFAIDIH